MSTRLLNPICSNNLLPTTHDNKMLGNMVWIMYSLKAQLEVDIPPIIYHKMLAEAVHSMVKSNLSYGVMITSLPPSCDVRFPEDALVLK